MRMEGPVAILNSKDVGNVLVVSFTDTKILDENRIAQIGQELLDLEMQAVLHKKMLVNFQSVEFMSSAMLGKLAALKNRAKADKVDLKLCCISANILQVFKMMGLKNISYSDEQTALEAFEKKGWFG